MSPIPGSCWVETCGDSGVKTDEQGRFLCNFHGGWIRKAVDAMTPEERNELIDALVGALDVKP